MKKLAIILLILSILLTACAIEAPVEETPGELEEETVPEETVPEEPIEEPVEEEVVEEEPEEPIEEPVEEEVVEEEVVEDEEGDANLFEIMQGDTVPYDGKSILVEDIGKYGSEVYLKEGAYRIKLSGTRSPEIVNNLEYEIVENTFNKNSKVKISIKPPVFGEDEYLVQKGTYVTVNNTKIELEFVRSEKVGTASAYFSVQDIVSDKWIKLGETKEVNGFEITLQRAFWKSRQYAVLKIVQK